ncbi:MAG: hypothetical protein V9H25_06480 [Candidatus Competibacter sp.]
MARKTNGKVVETVEVVETTPEAIEMTEQAETTTNEQVETQEQVENQPAEVETSAVETQTLLDDELDALSVIKDDLSDLDVDQLKSIINYCEELIESINRDAVEALEAQMREIQDRLFALRGSRKQFALEQSVKSDAKKAGRPIYNPNNPSEVYRFGSYPQWVKELVKPANGDRKLEREILNKIREQQAAK